MVEESGFQVASEAPRFYESHVERFMAPFVAALVEATVTKGASVLDVACGTGFATRAAAATAGESARVEGTDINPEMLAQARGVPAAPGISVTWSEASGLELPFGDDEFDAVICQQGLQFFPDPAGGVREMSRVTRAGGRIGVTVWCPSKQNPFLHHETAMLAHHGGGEQAEFGVPEEQMHAWFVEGGATDFAVELVQAQVDLPPVMTYVPEHLKAIPWSVSSRALPAEQRASALAELDAELAEYKTDNGLTLPFQSYLATATV